MFNRLGSNIVRIPWVYVIVWLLVTGFALFATFAGFGAGGLFDRLGVGATFVDGSESDKVAKLTTDESEGGTELILITGLDLSQLAENEQAAQIMQKVLDAKRTELAAIENVESVVDPFVFPDLNTTEAQVFLSAKADGFAIAVTQKSGLTSEQKDQVHEQVKHQVDTLRPQLKLASPNADIKLMSTKLVQDEILGQVARDLFRGEAVGLPIALILMVVVFGGLLAAGMPLIGGIVSILAAMGALLGLTYITGVESFILNVVSIIGLALSIDYGLLVVSRFREEAARQLGIHGLATDGSNYPTDKAERIEIAHNAVQIAVRTAGRTVFFSALTILFSISGLLVMKAPMLRSIAYGGIIVVALAVATAITLIPALLTILGKHLIVPSVISRIPGIKQAIRAVGDSASDHGAFSKLARWVHGRPLLIMIAVSGLLVAMCLPVSGLRLRSNFVEYIPKGSDIHQAYSLVQSDYPALATPDMTVVTQAKSGHVSDLDRQTIEQFMGQLQEKEHIKWVVDLQPLPVNGDQTSPGFSFKIKTDFVDPVGTEATNLLKDIRQISPPENFDVFVSGSVGVQYDFNKSLAEGAPWALLIMVVSVMVLLFLMTGSVIAPLKAIVLNSLSLVASIGVSVLLFENGLLGLPKVQGMETFVAACAVAFGFGLAMDYEVFLLARIKEYWDQGYENDIAVERGLQRSGRIITSAAAIIIAVFIGFVFGEMIAIKEIGVTLAIIVAVDATLVRLLLVPATMTILGKWNWWAPKPLAKLYEKFGISESDEEPLQLTLAEPAPTVSPDQTETTDTGLAAEDLETEYTQT